jgi:hypothetical protein
MTPDAPSPPPNFFRRCWQGSARLWQAFWLVGVIGKLILVTVVTLGAFMVAQGPWDGAVTYGLFVPMMAGYLVYASVSVWRCAPNAGHALWGYAARTIVVVVVVVWLAALLQEI